MKAVSTIENKILEDLRDLPPIKRLEVVDFVEYLRNKQSDWKNRFRSFLKKIEPKMKEVSYSDIPKEIVKVRNK